MRYVFFVLFIISVFFLPWWYTVALGIVVASMPYGSLFAIVGGVLMDVTFGAPLIPLFGLQYLYTTLFICVAIGVVLLERWVID